MSHDQPDADALDTTHTDTHALDIDQSDADAMDTAHTDTHALDIDQSDADAMDVDQLLGDRRYVRVHPTAPDPADSSHHE